jgi:hypothetical protein
VGFDLAPVAGQFRVVRGERKPGIDYAAGGVEVIRREVGVC